MIKTPKQTSYSLGYNWRLARYRAKCRLCTEWTGHKAPSTWSMPVVIMFPHISADITFLRNFNSSPSAKFVISRDVGSYVRLPQEGVRLLVDYNEYWAWQLVHTVQHCNVPLKILKDHEMEVLVTCGGRTDGPFYWSSTICNLPASCSRMCRVRESNRSLWTHAKNARPGKTIYRCPLCSA